MKTASKSSVEGADGVGDVVMISVRSSETDAGAGGAGVEDMTLPTERVYEKRSGNDPSRETDGRRREVRIWSELRLFSAKWGTTPERQNC